MASSVDILFVIPTLQRGGAERVISLLTNELNKDCSVLTICLDARGAAYSVGGKLIDLQVGAGDGFIPKIINVFLRSAKIRRIIKRYKPRKVVSFMEAASFPCVIAAYLCQMEKLVTVSVRINPAHLPIGRRILMAVLYRIANKIVGVSSGVCEYMIGKLKVPSNKCEFIPNPINFHLIDMKSKEPLPISNVGGRSFILGVGRLVPQKGFDILIRCFRAIYENYDVDLVILGEGPGRIELTKMIDHYRLNGRVHLMGDISNPWKWMRNCRIFILSSRYEGWPNALSEAMALGVPCIATDCETGPREIVGDTDGALLVPVGDEEALVNRVSYLLERRDEASRIGDCARRRMRDFSVSSIARKWMEE